MITPQIPESPKYDIFILLQIQRLKGQKFAPCVKRDTLFGILPKKFAKCFTSFQMLATQNLFPANNYRKLRFTGT